MFWSKTQNTKNIVLGTTPLRFGSSPHSPRQTPPFVLGFLKWLCKNTKGSNTIGGGGANEKIGVGEEKLRGGSGEEFEGEIEEEIEGEGEIRVRGNGEELGLDTSSSRKPPEQRGKMRSGPTTAVNIDGCGGGEVVAVVELDMFAMNGACEDQRICVWNASDGSLVHSLTGHSESTYVLDVHPFNPRIAMSAGYDGKTIIWDIWEGTPVWVFEIGRFKLVDGKFSP
ncbi:hypothetical protein Droror1_Dr00011017 [Drosera rotundifolia]